MTDLERRKFLKDLSAAVPGLALTPALLSCSADDPGPRQITTDKKVVVIGGGIAGLSAATYFKERGVHVTLLEAQSKVGGRIRTDRSLGVPFDEGASWIHGPKGTPITSLANKAAAETFVTNDDLVEVFDQDGTQYADKDLDTSESDFEKILDRMAGNVNESFADVFYAENPQYQSDRLWTYMLSAYLEFDTGGDIANLSSMDFYDDEAYPGKDKIITNGFDKVVKYLSSELDISLNTKVTGLDYTGETVEIDTDSGIVEADFVVITVPLGVLKKNVLSFNPSLPMETQAAIDGLQMGQINKFLLVWDDIFWNNDLHYIGYTPDTKGKFNYFLNANKFSDAKALMTFAFGNYSEQTEDMTDAEVITEIMDHLKTIYGGSIPEPTNMLRTRWVSNEFSFGSYSFATNGIRSTAFEQFEVPVEDRLFFAGEHTSRKYRATVHGACLSGIREAKKIVKLL